MHASLNQQTKKNKIHQTYPVRLSGGNHYFENLQSTWVVCCPLNFPSFLIHSFLIHCVSGAALGVSHAQHNSRMQPQRRIKTSRRQYSGFTLLEILLAVAILLIGLTAVLQTSRAALQRMSAAKELTEAQNACQSVLNELLAQAAPIQPDAGKKIGHLPNWRIRVDIYPAPQPGLYVLHLSAQEFSPIDDSMLGVKYQLIRWVPVERVRLPESVQPQPFSGNEFENLFQ